MTKLVITFVIALVLSASAHGLDCTAANDILEARYNAANAANTSGYEIDFFEFAELSGYDQCVGWNVDEQNDVLYSDDESMQSNIDEPWLRCERDETYAECNARQERDAECGANAAETLAESAD